MRHRRELSVLLLVLAAVALFMWTPASQTKPTPVTGVTAGMAPGEVEAALGPPDMKTDQSWTWFDGSRMDPRLVVTFDASGHVSRVYGKAQPAPSVAFTR